MRYLELESWNRIQHFKHFKSLKDPFFAITTSVDVTIAYKKAKKENVSFFALYLHACLKALNAVENFRYRIHDNKVAVYDVIHASATIARPNHTFGFSFINFSEDFKTFHKNFKKEKERILNSATLFPLVNSDDCMYCSALPWVSFTSQKEPNAGIKDDSIPKLAFGKFTEDNKQLKMPVGITVNHALVDGYHLGLFFKEFQSQLDKNN
ncbi:chloramphenicol acetyltransferase [Polaribacter sp.]|uniref:chloramphenicol acetyltransferase n=1 Tax=Polaribacter sp. TaxID=1920175 RepID=UPI0026011BE7|nr:chloramphenicol acetyltransferase [Polaribacter sp.]